MARVVAAVPVRMGSGRLPGKVLHPINGKPLLGRLLERARRAQRLDACVVATSTNTENDVIADYCAELGVACFRGSEDDVLGRIFGALQSQRADVGVTLFGDGPLIDPSIIDAIVGRFLAQRGQYDFVGNDLKTTYPPGMEVEAYEMSALAHANQHACDPCVREHGTLYIRQNPALYRLLNIEAPPEHHCPELELEVDTAEDLEVVATIFSALDKRAPGFGLSEIIAYMRENPQLAEKNRKVERRWKEFRDGT